MKLTKRTLRKLIKEEFNTFFEDLKKTRTHTLVSLYEFSKLVMSGERQASVTGMDTSAGVKTPIKMTLSLVSEEPVTSLVSSHHVAVEDDMLGQPFSVTQLGAYVFVLKP
jgi:hypothetical protein